MAAKKKDDSNILLLAKLKEYEGLLKRLQADFENYRKREERARSEFLVCASAGTIQKLLPFIDTLEAAAKVKGSGAAELLAQLLGILKQEGLEPIAAEGRQFDPNLHEVMLTENNRAIEDGIITQEIQKGYLLRDRVLRHAKVKVNKNNEGTGKDNKNNKRDEAA